MKLSDILSTITAIITIVTALGGLTTYALSKDPNKKKVIGIGFTALVLGLIIAFVALRYLNPTPHQWTQALQEFAPGCGDKSWVEPVPGTAATCPGTGLLMQQNDQGSNQLYAAEVDLDKVNGSIYSQTTFHVQVQISFQVKYADPTTVAHLLVQTPQTPNVAGGYAFGLNNTGYWQLIDASNNAIIGSGSIHIDVNQPIKVEVDVENNELTGFINGQQIVVHSDTLNPSLGAISLLVMRQDAAVSSAVLFSNFELDV